MRLEDAPEEAKGAPQARSASQSQSPGGLYSPQHISRKLEEIKASAPELPKVRSALEDTTIDAEIRNFHIEDIERDAGFTIFPKA